MSARVGLGDDVQDVKSRLSRREWSFEWFEWREEPRVFPWHMAMGIYMMYLISLPDAF